MARRKTKMTRNETIQKLCDMTIDLIKNGWTWDKYSEIWDLCGDWNRDHDGSGDDAEIFMCEIGDDDNYVIGWMIEDDPYYFPEDWK